jgi:hypothetical protein
LPGHAVLIHGTLPPAHLQARRYWQEQPDASHTTSGGPDCASMSRDETAHQGLSRLSRMLSRVASRRTVRRTAPVHRQPRHRIWRRAKR